MKIEIMTEKPWWQQPDESEFHYKRFQTFLELGSRRNLPELARVLTQRGDKVAHKTLQNSSHIYQWYNRAAAYDREQAEMRLRDMESARNAVQGLTYQNTMNLYQQVLDQVAQNLADAPQVAVEVVQAQLAAEGTHIDVEAKVNLATYREIATLLSKLNKELRICVGLPTNFSAQHLDINSKSELGGDSIASLADYIEKRQQEVDELRANSSGNGQRQQLPAPADHQGQDGA